MGDRITIRFMDNKGNSTPQLYSHYGGFAVLKKANELLMGGQYNALGNLMCNLILDVMYMEHNPMGSYLYNDTGNGQSHCDSRMWTYHEVDEEPNGWNGQSHFIEGYWTSNRCGDRQFTPEEIAEMEEEPYGE